jgi:hypothetical protein
VEFVLTPFPHVHLPEDPTRELIVNLVVYGMGFGLLGAFLWLCWLFWATREQ